ncbi:MAG: hypothetical protein PHS44_05700 [Candidatus Dojkabacteria bacterium]|nr:hypothetical protein [Candidatus Dojkabacteria bacterium]
MMETGEPLQIYSGTVPEKVFADISAATNHSNMLIVSESSIRESYSTGEAVIVWSETHNTWASFGRLVPLAAGDFWSRAERYGFTIPYNPVHVYELGTGIANPDLTSLGLRHLGRPFLLELQRMLIDRAGLGIATSTSPRALKNLVEMIPETRFVSFESFQMIATLTCVCSGHHGTGYQMGDYCSVRASDEERDLYYQILISGEALPDPNKCVFAVLDLDLALQVEQDLKRTFRSRETLLKLLWRINQYE